MVVFISNKKIFNFIIGKIILVLSAVKLVLHQSMILKMIMRKIMIWVWMSLTDQDQDLEEADSTITVRSMWRAMDFQGKIKLFFFKYVSLRNDYKTFKQIILFFMMFAIDLNTLNPAKSFEGVLLVQEMT